MEVVVGEPEYDGGETGGATLLEAVAEVREAAGAETTEATPARGTRGTWYVVLAGVPEDEDGGGAPAWYPEGERRATSPGAAIRAWLADNPPEESGLYVAVPARSWNPVRVELETRTALRLGAL